MVRKSANMNRFAGALWFFFCLIPFWNAVYKAYSETISVGFLDITGNPLSVVGKPYQKGGLFFLFFHFNPCIDAYWCITPPDLKIALKYLFSCHVKIQATALFRDIRSQDGLVCLAQLIGRLKTKAAKQQLGCISIPVGFIAERRTGQHKCSFTGGCVCGLILS